MAARSRPERRFEHLDVRVIVPALNEAESLPSLLERMPVFVKQVLVVDNGSTDNTAEIAAACGARVVYEPNRGYGQACLTGIKDIGTCDVIVFADADSCAVLDKMAELVRPIHRGTADFVLSSRRESGALSLQQRFGNGLACLLMRALWGAQYTDLGPFRAITPQALDRLEMQDTNFGWTVEMQIRAAALSLPTVEVAMPEQRRRHGRSKISGTLSGVISAGTKILFVIAREALRNPRHTRIRGLWRMRSALRP